MEETGVVLGRMTARLLQPIPVGHERRGGGLAAWAATGRKLYSGTAFYGAGGCLHGYARQTWIVMARLTRLRPTGGQWGATGRKAETGRWGGSGVTGGPGLAELAAEAGEGRRRVLEAVVVLVVPGEADAAARRKRKPGPRRSCGAAAAPGRRRSLASSSASRTSG